MTLWDEAGLPPLSIRARLRFDVVSRVVDDLGPRTVLEVGCGQGAVGARLATRATYVGVEPDARSCEVARLRIEPRGGTVVQGTDRDVEVGRTFDLVCAFEVLEHIEDDVAALRDWAARVRPGGDLLLSVPADQQRFGPWTSRSGTSAGTTRTSCPRRPVGRPGRGQDGAVRWPLAHVLEGVRNGLDRRRRAAAREQSSKTCRRPVGGPSSRQEQSAGGPSWRLRDAAIPLFAKVAAERRDRFGAGRGALGGLLSSDRKPNRARCPSPRIKTARERRAAPTASGKDSTELSPATSTASRRPAPAGRNTSGSRG